MRARRARSARVSAAISVVGPRGTGIPDHARGGARSLTVAARRTQLTGGAARIGRETPRRASDAIQLTFSILILAGAAREAACVAHRSRKRHPSPSWARLGVSRSGYAKVAFRARSGASFHCEVVSAPVLACGAGPARGGVKVAEEITRSWHPGSEATVPVRDGVGAVAGCVCAIVSAVASKGDVAHRGPCSLPPMLLDAQRRVALPCIVDEGGVRKSNKVGALAGAGVSEHIECAKPAQTGVASVMRMGDRVRHASTLQPPCN